MPGSKLVRLLSAFVLPELPSEPTAGHYQMTRLKLYACVSAPADLDLGNVKHSWERAHSGTSQTFMDNSSQLIRPTYFSAHVSAWYSPERSPVKLLWGATDDGLYLQHQHCPE
jgi:hypothetical protein